MPGTIVSIGSRCYILGREGGPDLLPSERAISSTRGGGNAFRQAAKARICPTLRVGHQSIFLVMTTRSRPVIELVAQEPRRWEAHGPDRRPCWRGLAPTLCWTSGLSCRAAYPERTRRARTRPIWGDAAKKSRRGGPAGGRSGASADSAESNLDAGNHRSQAILRPKRSAIRPSSCVQKVQTEAELFGVTSAKRNRRRSRRLRIIANVQTRHVGPGGVRACRTTLALRASSASGSGRRSSASAAAATGHRGAPAAAATGLRGILGLLGYRKTRALA
jgi:hypothetical protein